MAKLNLILSHPKIFRELLRLINKFQFNFGVRSIINCEQESLTENYLQGIYNITVQSYRCNLPTKETIICELMANMNQIWQRFNFETIQLKLELQSKVEGFITDIIQVQVDENLNQIQNITPDDDDGDLSGGSEDFDKSQRLQKHDDYDQFSKLMRTKIEFSIPLILERLT